jgi:hypothetical protein
MTGKSVAKHNTKNRSFTNRKNKKIILNNLPPAGSLMPSGNHDGPNFLMLKRKLFGHDLLQKILS